MARGPEDYWVAPFPATIAGAGQIVQLNLMAGLSVVCLEVSGTWAGTLVFEASQDVAGLGGPGAATWFPVNAVTAGNTFQTVPSATANGNFFILCGGFSAVRVRASAWSSGTANVFLVGQTSQPAAGFVVGNTKPNIQLLSAVLSGTAGTNVLGSPVLNLDAYRSIIVYLTASGLAGTTPTCDIYLQSTPDGGTTWFDVAHLPQITAATAVGYLVSFTRGDANATAPRVVNSANGTPVLAVNTMIPDGLGNGLRVLTVMGGTVTTQETITAIGIAGSQ